MRKNIFAQRGVTGGVAKSMNAHISAIADKLKSNTALVLSAGVEDLYSGTPESRESAATESSGEMAQFDKSCNDIDEEVSAIMSEAQADIEGGDDSEGVTAGASAGVENYGMSAGVRTAIRQLVHSARSEADARKYHAMTSAYTPNGAGQGKAMNAHDFAAGIEAFDSTDYRNTVARSIAYAAATVGQGAVAEAVFKTEILTPDQGNYQFRVLIPTVYDEAARDVNGNPYDLQPRRLVDATRYKDILIDDLTEVVPVYKVARATKFADPAVVTPWTTTRDGMTFTTSALALGVSMDLVALNSLEEIANRGASNSTDSLDRGVSLDSIFLKVRVGSATTIFVVNTSGMLGHHFQPGQEGLQTALFLNFSNTIYISALTPTLDGAPAAVLAPILALDPDAVVSLTLTMHGNLDQEKANISVSAGQMAYANLYARSDTGHRRTTITDPTTVAAAEAAFAAGNISVVGWLPKARVSNVNRRDQGHVMRVQTKYTSFPVYLNSPFTARTAAGGNHDADKAELRKLAFVAARISNDLAAHATIWDNIENLRQWKGMGNETTDFAWAQLGYVADDYIEPFFDEITVDLLRDVNSTGSAMKLNDITATLALNITDLGLTAIRESNINSALAILGAPDYKVDIIAACDPYTEAYLRLIGDARTAGSGYKVIPVSTVDERWRDVITLSLRVTLEGDASILNSGKHLNMPRYVTDLVIPRDGAVTNEVTIQTRRQYIITCPIAAVINVANLSKAVRSLLKFQTQI